MRAVLACVRVADESRADAITDASILVLSPHHVFDSRGLPSCRLAVLPSLTETNSEAPRLRRSFAINIPLRANQTADRPNGRGELAAMDEDDDAFLYGDSSEAAPAAENTPTSAQPLHDTKQHPAEQGQTPGHDGNQVSLGVNNELGGSGGEDAAEEEEEEEEEDDSDSVSLRRWWGLLLTKEAPF